MWINCRLPPAQPSLALRLATLLHSTKKAPPTLDARDRRLIVLFFDFSAMEPEQIDRSVDAAKKFVTTKMQPADLIALVSLATNMHVDCDFTDDKDKLLALLSSLQLRPGPGLRQRRHRQRRRHSRNQRLLYRRRHRPQHLLRRSQTSRSSIPHASPSASYRRRKASSISAMASAKPGWTTNPRCAPPPLPRLKPTPPSIPSTSAASRPFPRAAKRKTPACTDNLPTPAPPPSTI